MKILSAPLLALVVSIAIASANLHAQETEPVDSARKAAADKLLRLFKIDQNIGAAFDQVQKMQSAMLDQQKLSEEAKERATRAMEESMKATREEFTWEKMGPMFVEIYAEVFTKDELDALIEFYDSPIGKKFIEKQPQLQAATMKRMQSLMMELMPKISEKVKAAAASAKSDESEESEE